MFVRRWIDVALVYVTSRRSAGELTTYRKARVHTENVEGKRKFEGYDLK